MTELSEEEKKQILRASPRGTWVMLLIFGILFVLAWLSMYYGIFVARGPVN